MNISSIAFPSGYNALKNCEDESLGLDDIQTKMIDQEQDSTSSTDTEEAVEASDHEEFQLRSNFDYSEDEEESRHRHPVEDSEDEEYETETDAEDEQSQLRSESERWEDEQSRLRSSELEQSEGEGCGSRGRAESEGDEPPRLKGYSVEELRAENLQLSELVVALYEERELRRSGGKMNSHPAATEGVNEGDHREALLARENSRLKDQLACLSAQHVELKRAMLAQQERHKEQIHQYQRENEQLLDRLALTESHDTKEVKEPLHERTPPSKSQKENIPMESGFAERTPERTPESGKAGYEFRTPVDCRTEPPHQSRYSPDMAVGHASEEKGIVRMNMRRGRRLREDERKEIEFSPLLPGDDSSHDRREVSPSEKLEGKRLFGVNDSFSWKQIISPFKK